MSSSTTTTTIIICFATFLLRTSAGMDLKDVVAEHLFNHVPPEQIAIKLTNVFQFTRMNADGRNALKERFFVELECLKNGKKLTNLEGKSRVEYFHDGDECRFDVMTTKSGTGDEQEHQCPKDEYIVHVYKYLMFNGISIPNGKQWMYREIWGGTRLEVEYHGSKQYDKTTAITVHVRDPVSESTSYRVRVQCIANGKQLKGSLGLFNYDICRSNYGCVFPLVKKNSFGRTLTYAQCPDQRYRIEVEIPLDNVSIYEAKNTRRETFDVNIPRNNGEVTVELTGKGAVQQQQQ